MITKDVYKIIFINIWILALGMIMNYAAEISNLFIAVICLVLVFKGVKKVKYCLLVSSRKIIRLSIVTIILNLIVFEYYNLDVTTDFVPIEYCLYLVGISEVLAMKEDVQVLSREEINKYSKVKSLQSLLMSGLNVHEFYVFKNFESLWQSYIALGKVCTIRTDKAYAKPGSQLGFFIARYIAPSELKKIADVIKQNGCIAIISNGLKYDDHLRYNIVYKIEENGDFYCEFSRLKVPLRHMYRHPESLRTVREKHCLQMPLTSVCLAGALYICFLAFHCSPYETLLRFCASPNSSSIFNVTRHSDAAAFTYRINKRHKLLF